MARACFTTVFFISASLAASVSELDSMDAASLEQSVLKMASAMQTSKGTNFTDSLNGILKLTKTMRGAIKEAHNDATTEMVSAADRNFENCNRRHVEESQIKINRDEKLVAQQSGKHENCRAEQGTQQQKVDVATEKHDSKEMIYNRKKYNLETEFKNAKWTCPGKDGQETYIQWLESTMKGADEAKNRFGYLVEQEKVAKVNFETAEAELKKENEVFGAKKRECEQDETILYDMGCDLAGYVKDNCNNFEDCWSAATKSSVDLTEDMSKSIESRKNEYRILDRIECYLQVLMEASGHEDKHVEQAQMDECKKKSFDDSDTDKFNVDHHKPQKGECPTTPAVATYFSKHPDLRDYAPKVECQNLQPPSYVVGR